MYNTLCELRAPTSAPSALTLFPILPLPEPVLAFMPLGVGSQHCCTHVRNIYNFTMPYIITKKIKHVIPNAVRGVRNSSS
jgi:hypothetical protein